MMNKLITLYHHVNELPTIPTIIVFIIVNVIVWNIASTPIPLTPTTNISHPVASIAPEIKTAMQICSAKDASHYHIVDINLSQWQAILDEHLKDDKGNEIRDSAGAAIITRYRAIITLGPDGLSSDVALFHSTTGKLENPSSEPNTPQITACIQKNAEEKQAVP